MSLSQIELVWVRVRVEWECFWVNLREDNKVSESKIAVSESNMTEFKMAAIIKLSQNEWVKYFLCKMAEAKMAEFKMAAIIKLNENERLKFFFLAKWMNPTWQNLSWLPSFSWVRENEWSFFVQMVGTNLGKCEWLWDEILRWLNPRWPNSRWQNLRFWPSSSWVRMNEFESDWISLSQSQSGVRVFLSESERR